MRERSVYSINQRRRLEAETTHEREERLQQLSDNQQRKLDTILPKYKGFMVRSMRVLVMRRRQTFKKTGKAWA